MSYWLLHKDRAVPNVDKELRAKNPKRWRRCPKGHLNSPVALVCWKCGLTIPREKKEVVHV